MGLGFEGDAPSPKMNLDESVSPLGGRDGVGVWSVEGSDRAG